MAMAMAARQLARRTMASATSTAGDIVKNAVEPAKVARTKSGGLSLWTFMATTNLRLIPHVVPFVGLLAWYTAEGLDFYRDWKAIEQPARRS